MSLFFGCFSTDSCGLYIDSILLVQLNVTIAFFTIGKVILSCELFIFVVHWNMCVMCLAGEVT